MRERRRRIRLEVGPRAEPVLQSPAYTIHSPESPLPRIAIPIITPMYNRAVYRLHEKIHGKPEGGYLTEHNTPIRIDEHGEESEMDALFKKV